jgi:hypothetical protein
MASAITVPLAPIASVDNQVLMIGSLPVAMRVRGGVVPLAWHAPPENVNIN